MFVYGGLLTFVLSFGGLIVWWVGSGLAAAGFGFLGCVVLLFLFGFVLFVWRAFLDGGLLAMWCG